MGLAYSALVLGDASLAAEVRLLEDRLDDMQDRLELWVLRAARDDLDPAPLRGLLHLSWQAAADLGDQAQQMVWLIEQREEPTLILHRAWRVGRRRRPGAGRGGLDGRRGPPGRPPARGRPRLPHPGHPPRRPLPVPATARCSWSPTTS